MKFHDTGSFQIVKEKKMYNRRKKLEIFIFMEM